MRDAYGLPKDKPVIGFVGSLIRRKGIDVLFKAVARLKEDYEYHVVLVGDGDKEWVWCLSRELGELVAY